MYLRLDNLLAAQPVGIERLTCNAPQTIDHFITYSVIASAPALTYSSVISTIHCYAVTTGPNEGSTFVQWSAHFSSDADAGNIYIQ